MISVNLCFNLVFKNPLLTVMISGENTAFHVRQTHTVHNIFHIFINHLSIIIWYNYKLIILLLVLYSQVFGGGGEGGGIMKITYRNSFKNVSKA